VQLTLTQPVTQYVKTSEIFVSEAIGTGCMTLASLYLHHTDELGTSRVPAPGDALREPAGVGGVYAALIAIFAPQTGASFILSRSLRPAIVLASYAHLQTYVYAQLAGTAVVVGGWYLFMCEDA
jgi:hypothetical protein